MSSTHNNHLQRHEWGPQHQQPEAPPAKRSIFWSLVGWFGGALFLHGIIDPGGANVFNWCVNAVIFGWIGRWVYRGIRDGHIPIDWLVRRAQASRWGLAMLFARYAPLFLVKPVARHRAHRRSLEPEPYYPTADDARYKVQSLGGGAYLGVDQEGEWVTATPHSATLVLGPPRSGKTMDVEIPTIIAASGPVISTATKPEVMEATMFARGEIGDVWLFDPSGEYTELPQGIRRLCWSPVAAATTWDAALLTSRAMTACTRVGAGTTNETHWTERAAALLAPLLLTANLTERPIEEVLRWTLRQDLVPAMEFLAEGQNAIAADVLVGIQRTDTRERSSIFSAAAGVLSAYNSDGARHTAADPNFDADAFVLSTDTIYITAPEHHQAFSAPLIVGMLEQVRHACYRAAAKRYSAQRMLWVLDEFANIAPIPDVLALASQAGGQRLDLMLGLQDLGQVASRYGQHVADAFMTLFQTKLILKGVSDPRTLEAISQVIGDYDREIISNSAGTSESGEWFSPPGKNQSVSYQTHRQRIVAPSDIADLPDRHGLLMRGASWSLIETTRWFESDPWASIGNHTPILVQ
jgi:type IV secretion system protein VirD4